MLYLAPYAGSGTRKDPYRPKGVDGFATWGAVDLRPDPSVVDGFALLSLDSTPNVAGLTQIGSDKTESTAAATKQLVGSRLSLDLSAAQTLEELIAELLFTDTKPWRFVTPNAKGEKFVFIGGRLWAYKQVEPPKRGELVDPTDDFNRANEDPIAGNWTNVGTSNIRLVSNTMGGPAGTGDGLAYYNAFTPQNDQFSQIVVATPSDNDWGIACRISVGAFNGYLFALSNVNGWQSAKIVSGAFSTIEGFTSGPNLVAGDVARIEVAGSTITAIVNGVEVGGSPSTDTSLTSGRAGVFIFNDLVRLDNWQAGDIGGAGVAAPDLPNYLRASGLQTNSMAPAQRRIS